MHRRGTKIYVECVHPASWRAVLIQKPYYPAKHYLSDSLWDCGVEQDYYSTCAVGYRHEKRKLTRMVHQAIQTLYRRAVQEGQRQRQRQPEGEKGTWRPD